MPCDPLRELVARRQWDRADAIRIEYGKHGIPIALHPIYEDAAINAYLEEGSREDGGHFEDWWQLVPDRSLCPGGRSFEAVINALMHRQSKHIPTLHSFIRIAASKGWIRDVQDAVLPFAVRHSTPRSSMALLVDVLDNAQGYVQKHAHDPTVNAHFSGGDLLSTALRSAIIAGRQQLALMIVELAFVYQVAVDRYQLAYFAKSLKTAKAEDVLLRVRQLVADNYWLVGYRPEELDTMDLRPGYVSKGPTAYRAPLPLVVRIISRNILTNSPPRATAIAHFIARYLRQGRTRAILGFRRKVIHSPRLNQTASLWFTAEMKFWLLYGRHDMVLKVYSTVFTSPGLPPDLINRALSPGRQLARKRLSNYAEHLQLPPINIPWRLFPSSHAQVMAWSALTRMEHDHDSLQTLYQRFLIVVDSFIAARDGTLAEDEEEHSPEALKSLRPSLMPDSSHFTPFVIRFARLSGPHRAITVLRDMAARGISPGQHAWFYALRAHTQAEDLQGAYDILAAVEQLGSPDWDAVLAPSNKDRETRSIRHRFGAVTTPQVFPTIQFYQLVLRLLVRRKRYDEAEELVRRVEQMGYVPGRHRKFDTFVAAMRLYHSQCAVCACTRGLNSLTLLSSSFNSSAVGGSLARGTSASGGLPGLFSYICYCNYCS